VTQLKPDSHKAWDTKGYVQMQLKRDEEAIASFNRAIKIKPDYASAYYNKASCYATQGEADLALESLQRAIELNPKYRKEAKVDPNFDELVGDDWFIELMEGR
jgi:tetratricopeptide (TPR) repeat protein